MRTRRRFTAEFKAKVDRRAVPGDAVVRLASDGAAFAAQRVVRWPASGPAADDQDGFGADLSASEDQRAASSAQDPSVSASASDYRGRRNAEVGLHRVRQLPSQHRSLKYECVFLRAFETGSEARAGIGRWIG